MAELFIGSNGLSLWSSADLGDTLERMSTGAGMYSGSQVWALSASAVRAQQLYMGTDTGVYVLDRNTGKCRHLPSQMDKMLVTALAHDMEDPDTLYAGTQPAGMYKSVDAGATWRKLDAPMKRYVASGFPGSDMHQSDSDGVVVRHWTRVTAILVDPGDSRTLLAGVEIDGAWKSIDGGETWQEASSGFVTRDIHGFCRAGKAGAPATLFATTNKGLHKSSDGGATWQFQKIDSPWQYCRSIVRRPDNIGVMFLTNGDGPPGSTGRLYRSRNFGADWEQVALPATIDSSVYWVAVDPADPLLVFVATNLGQLFRSGDGGETWTALRRRLGEIRALLWLPHRH